MNYNRNDIYYWFIIGMLGLTMYWVYIVVAPTFEIVTNTNTLLNKMDSILGQGLEQNSLTIEQNKKIIQNQNNNSASLKRVITQAEQDRQTQLKYLFAVLNQSNVIGNATADLILESIGQVQELETNQTEERRIQTKGIIAGFSLLLKDADEELDKIKEIVIGLAQKDNVTLSNETLLDEFRLTPNNFTFPNGTTINITDLFRPAAAQLEEENTTGKISGFLGGPMILNRSIPKGVLDLNITGNNTNTSQSNP